MLHKLYYDIRRKKSFIVDGCFTIPTLSSKWWHFGEKKVVSITILASAIPDPNNSSRAAWFALPEVILLTSLFKLFRSFLYSLNLERSVAFMLGCKLLASRSIFRIWNNSDKGSHYKSKNVKRKNKLSHRKCLFHYQSISIIQSCFDFSKFLLLLFCKSRKQETKEVTVCTKQITQ